jgi:hypothetical protein
MIVFHKEINSSESLHRLEGMIVFDKEINSNESLRRLERMTGFDKDINSNERLYKLEVIITLNKGNLRSLIKSIHLRNYPKKAQSKSPPERTKYQQVLVHDFLRKASPGLNQCYPRNGVTVIAKILGEDK